MNGAQEGYVNKIKDKLFSCLREREKGGDWETLLDSILVELMGIEEDKRSINYYTIFYKLSSCRYLSYKYFRIAIFDVMALLSKWVLK